MLSILTQRPSTFPLAKKLVADLDLFAQTVVEDPAKEIHAFCNMLYESALAAEKAVVAQTSKPASFWG